MKMDAGLDTGDILTQARTPIQTEDDAQTLHDRLAKMGAELLVQTISDYVAGRIASRPQPAEGITHARKIEKQDGRIDWNQPARAIWNQVRVSAVAGGIHAPARTTAAALAQALARGSHRASRPAGEILQADKTRSGGGLRPEALRILVLQREGGRRVEAQAFPCRAPAGAGEKLG